MGAAEHSIASSQELSGLAFCSQTFPSSLRRENARRRVSDV